MRCVDESCSRSVPDEPIRSSHSEAPASDTTTKSELQVGARTNAPSAPEARPKKRTFSLGRGSKMSKMLRACGLRQNHRNKHGKIVDQQAPRIAEETHHALDRALVDEALSRIPRTLLKSRDMIMILNARGTVILNPAFHSSYQAQRIVALATLAAELWVHIVSGLGRGDEVVTHAPAIGTTAEKRAWM